MVIHILPFLFCEVRSLHLIHRIFQHVQLFVYVCVKVALDLLKKPMLHQMSIDDVLYKKRIKLLLLNHRMLEFLDEHEFDHWFHSHANSCVIAPSSHCFSSINSSLHSRCVRHKQSIEYRIQLYSSEYHIVRANTQLVLQLRIPGSVYQEPECSWQLVENEHRPMGLLHAIRWHFNMI